MAKLFDGAFNAYENNKLKLIKADLQQEIGQTSSIFGYQGFMPTIQKVWENVTMPLQVAGGFVFGAEKNNAPLIEVPEAIAGTQYAKDLQEYANLKTQQVQKEVAATKLKVTQFYNPSAWNDALAMEQAAKHIEEKADAVILPMRDNQASESTQAPRSQSQTPISDNNFAPIETPISNNVLESRRSNSIT
jgi:hypothetical protein